MDPNYLDFEQPIVELINKIESLRLLNGSNELDINKEIAILQEKTDKLTAKVFADLSPWQISKLARHSQRPYTLDYIKHIFTDVVFLHGDRHFADDKAIVGCLAKIDGRAVMVIGHQKGRAIKEKIFRNFGMPKPEGYRKACRLMQLAEKFNLPIITFIDTPGAYPGIDAEERGQSEAIAHNLAVMSKLKVPIISIVIGEGGSGGALAIGVCDKLLILQYSIYSVISPEGCASILWKDAAYAEQAAVALGITADKLHELKIVDKIIAEPLGGSHRQLDVAAKNVAKGIIHAIEEASIIPVEQLVDQRYTKLMNYGFYEKT